MGERVSKGGGAYNYYLTSGGKGRGLKGGKGPDQIRVGGACGDDDVIVKRSEQRNFTRRKYLFKE